MAAPFTVRERKATMTQSNLQPPQMTLIPCQAVHLQRLIPISAQDQFRAFGHQNAHLRLLSCHRSPGFTGQSQHDQWQPKSCSSSSPTDGEVWKHSGGQWSLSVPRPAVCSQAFMAD